MEFQISPFYQAFSIPTKYIKSRISEISKVAKIWNIVKELSWPSLKFMSHKNVSKPHHWAFTNTGRIPRDTFLLSNASLPISSFSKLSQALAKQAKSNWVADSAPSCKLFYGFFASLGRDEVKFLGFLSRLPFYSLGASRSFLFKYDGYIPIFLWFSALSTYSGLLRSHCSWFFKSLLKNFIERWDLGTVWMCKSQ